MSDHPTCDEAFFTHAEVAAAFPGVAPERLADLHRQWIQSGPCAWPPGLPEDFDHQFLRRLGLPCGTNDPTRETYALLHEVGGWRVWPVSVLVDRTLVVDGVPWLVDRLVRGHGIPVSAFARSTRGSTP